MRRRKRVAQGRRLQGLNTKASPLPPLPLRRQPTPLSHMDSPPFCSALPPSAKGWDIYGNFLPYLPEALPLYGPLRHPVSKGWGIFSAFYPYLWQTPGTFATLFPPSKVHPSPIKQACRTPQRRFLYGTVSRVPRVQKEAVFLYRTCLKAARVQQKAPFLYRTENRLKVIEL